MQPCLLSRSSSHGGAVCRHELELPALSGLKHEVSAATEYYAAVLVRRDDRSAKEYSFS